MRTAWIDIDGERLEVPFTEFVKLGDITDWYATTGFVREPHFMACDRTHRIVRKREVRLETKQRLINKGDVVMVSWVSPDPIKLWVNGKPVIGAQSGKSISPYLFSPQSTGQYRVHVRDSRYRAKALVVVCG